jgi:uncharacterized protein YecE (DUF72 family)
MGASGLRSPAMMAGRIRVGCSGWQYKHWRGNFYPEDLPQKRWFEHYASIFDTVEINNSFYRLPPPETFAKWREQAPRRFVYAVKASRFLTHMKKLKDPKPGLAKFFQPIENLGKKLGPIVFQLPPGWHCNAERLESFLKALPRKHRYSFELRDPSWHNQAVYNLLRRHNAAFCLYELAGFQSPEEITADFTYVRLHGPLGAYQGSYTKEQLASWSRRIRRWRRELKQIYIYFDNDQAGYAALNALELRKMLKLSLPKWNIKK